jgi:hypothetical protein
LGRREVGWPFNFEADVLTKAVVNWLGNGGAGERVR